MAIKSPLDLQTTEDIPQEIIPPDDPLTVMQEPQEAPVDAGASAFIDGEEYITAMLPGLNKVIRQFSFPAPVVKAGEKPTVTVIKKNIKENVEPTPRFIDPNSLSPEEAAARAEKEAVMLHESDLSQFDTTQTHQINMDTFHTHDDAKAVQAQMAEAFSSEIDEARRGVMYDEQLAAFAKDLGNDPVFIDEFLKKEFGTGVNAEQILAARSILEASARRLKELAHVVAKGDAGPRQQIDFLNQFDFHRQWMAQFMGARAELGRGLRALRGDVPMTADSLNKGDPVVPVNRMEELVNHWGGTMDIQLMAEQIASNDTYLGVNKLVQASKGGMNKWGAAFVESYVGSLLSGVKTQVVNLVGNALMTVKGPVEVALAARLGRNLPSDSERVMAGEATAMLFGMTNSFRDALGAMAEAFKTGASYGGVGKFEMGHNKAISSEALGLSGVAGWLADVYGPIARAPMERLLGPMDAFFKVINERAAFAQLSYREAMRQGSMEGLTNDQILVRLQSIMENPNVEAPGMMQEVIDYGLYSTFQNPLGPAGQGLQKVINSHAILKMLAPFVRTPVNILKVGFLEGTPLGLLQKEYKKAIESGNNAKVQTARARMMIGSSVLTMFGLYAMTGKITGSGPRDSNQRAALMATGWRPRSIRVDNEDGTSTYVSFDRLEPMSLTLGLAADIYEAMSTMQYDDLDATTQDLIAQATSAVSMAIAENSINKTYMQGVNDALKAIEDPTRYFDRWITNMANAAIPLSGLRRDARKLNDEYVREAQGFVDKLRNANPYFSEGLPPKLDVFGEPIKYEVFLNPYSLIDVEPSFVDAEIQRLISSTGETPVTRPMKKQWGGVELNSQQYFDMMYLSRKGIKHTATGGRVMPGTKLPNNEKLYSFKEYLEVVMTDPAYLEMTDFARVAEIKKIQSALDNDARKAILLIHDDLKTKHDRFKTVNPARRMLGDQVAKEVLTREVEAGLISTEAVNF